MAGWLASPLENLDGACGYECQSPPTGGAGEGREGEGHTMLRRTINRLGAHKERRDPY